jgi:hypothetical protein
MGLVAQALFLLTYLTRRIVPPVALDSIAVCSPLLARFGQTYSA